MKTEGAQLLKNEKKRKIIFPSLFLDLFLSCVEPLRQSWKTDYILLHYDSLSLFNWYKRIGTTYKKVLLGWRQISASSKSEKKTLKKKGEYSLYLCLIDAKKSFLFF